MARWFRSAMLSVSSAIHSVSCAAPRRRSILRCWLRLGGGKRWQGGCRHAQV
jgi:hypothetical protein